MKVGFYQYRPLFGKIQHNARKVVKKLDGVQADLIVLPELAFTGYYFAGREEVKTLAEDTEKSDTLDALVDLCRRNRFYIVTGFAEKSSDRYFNSALLIGPEGLLHTYRKIHLFNEEMQWFDEGDIPLQVNNIDGAKLGIMVCFDWAFPEAARVLALEGAELLCHPSNLVLGYCQQAMLTRCLENKVYAITANRYGYDKRPHGNLRFTGHSQIVAPGGTLIHRASAQRDALYILDLDPALARDKSMTLHNDVLRDRRPQFYQSLTARKG